MKRVLPWFWLLLSCVLSTKAQNGPDYLPGYKWPVGEKITYQLYWGFIPVGLATVQTDWTESEGRKLLGIHLRTQSNKVIEKIYPVDDTIESLIDPQTLLPLKFTKNMSEGSHRYFEVTVFDHSNRLARWESKLTGKTKTMPIDTDTRDIPSLMYFLRNHKFEPGNRDHFRVMADEKIYDLWLNIQKEQRVDLPERENVACIKIEPEASFNGLFVRKGRMWVWVSNDPRCLAARIEASVPVANVHAILIRVEGPGDDAWVTAPSAKK